MPYAHEAAIIYNIAARQAQAGEIRPSMYGGLDPTRTSSACSGSISGNLVNRNPVSGNPCSGAGRPT